MSNGSVIWTDHHGNKSYAEGDNRHRFERAGLGKAPFRVTGYGRHVFQAIPGDPSCPLQPGTSCDYCGTGCMDVANVRSSDGKEFKVGLDCAAKIGDAGLVSQIKRSPEYRKLQREKRHSLDERKKGEIEGILSAMLADPAMAAQAQHFQYRLGWCGAAGRARILKELRELRDSQP